MYIVLHEENLHVTKELCAGISGLPGRVKDDIHLFLIFSHCNLSPIDINNKIVTFYQLGKTTANVGFNYQISWPVYSLSQ